MNPDNLHLILTLLLIVLFFIRIPLIILQLPLQSRNNTLNTPRPLPLLKRKIPSPIPSPCLLIRFKRRPFPQLTEFRLAKRLVLCARVESRCLRGICTSNAAARDPVFDARIEFRAEELLQGICLRAAGVFGAWVGD